MTIKEELENITSIKELHKLYRKHHITSVNQKIVFLDSIIGVKFNLMNKADTPEEILYAKEEYVLSKLWVSNDENQKCNCIS